MKCYRDSILATSRSRIMWTFLWITILSGCQSGPRHPRASKMKTATLQQVALAAGDTAEQKAAIPQRVTLAAGDTVKQKVTSPLRATLAAGDIVKQKAAIPQQVALAAGDVVEVKFFYTPDLNETQTVRPDGKIALQLVGEVAVEGKKPAELRDELLELYRPHLKAPEITVVVRLFHNRQVFVSGQVMKPGIVEMPARITVLETIMRAGGFNLREAEVRNVIVIRYKNGQRYGYSVNLKSALAGKESEPFFLEPKDVVYVPRTKIAKLGQWIDQHINKIIPDTGFFFRRTLGDTAVGVGTSR